MVQRALTSLLALASLLAPTTLAQARLVYRSQPSVFGARQASLSADGRHVALAGDPNAPFTQLWLASLDLSEAPRRIALEAASHRMTNQGGLVYVERASGQTRLMRLDLDGGDPPVTLYPDSVGPNLAFSLGDTHVAFAVWTGTAYQFHCAAVDGSSPATKVSGDLSTLPWPPPRFDAGGGRLLFLAAGPSGNYELHSALRDGSAPPVLLYAATAGESVALLRAFPTVGGRLVFHALTSTGLPRVLSVPVDGSAPALELTAGIGAYEPDGYTLAVSPDGARTVFGARQLLGPVRQRYWQKDLLIVPTDGSAAPRRLNGELVRGGNVVDLVDLVQGGFTPDSQRYIYVADQAEDERFELFSVSVDGSAAPMRLHPTLPAGGDVSGDFLLSTDESCRVVFRSDLALDGLDELWSVPADGSAPPLRLNSPLPPGGVRDVFEFRFDPARRTVLYLANEDGPFGVELHSVPSDGRQRDERLSSIQTVDNPFLPIEGFSSRSGSTVFLRFQARYLAALDVYAHRAPRAESR